MRGRRHVALAILLALADSLVPGTAAARDAVVPAVGETVDATAAPWSSIGRVNNSLGGNCTGVLVAPDRLLTAAHCVFNDRTGRYLRPESMHVLLGFARGDYVFHGRAVAYRVADGFRPGAGTVGSDYAVLMLAEPAPASIVPLWLARAPATDGTRVVAVGYGRGRPTSRP